MLLVIFYCVVSVVTALENGLARTPPMGWLSWERFGCETDCSSFPSQCISQQLYVDMADKLVELGLSDLGYKYVNIDDCWSEKERVGDELFEDKTRFPNGMRWLSDYVHSKGLLFGMYTDIGPLTCGGYPGLAGFVREDLAKFLVSWNIDSLKVDGCYAEVTEMKRLYSELSDAFERPVLYSCSWPAYQEDHCENEGDMTTLVDKCNLWRNYGDIQDSFSSVRGISDFFARKNDSDIIVKSAGPGHWNDPDMLVVGNPGLSISEQKTQFAIWAILAAPLYISADLRTIGEESLAILKNQEIIAINQDILGRQGYALADSDSHRVWVRELSPGSEGQDRRAVLFENKSQIFGKIRFNFRVAQLGWETRNDGGPVQYSVRDVYRGKDIFVIPETKKEEDVFIVYVDESSVEFFVFTLLEGKGEDSISVILVTE